MAANPDQAAYSVRIADPVPPEVPAEPPWLQPPSPRQVEWQCFSRFHDALGAQIVAGRLELEEVPTILMTSQGAEPWVRVDMFVPAHLLHRARWVLAWPPVPEEQLLLLATGEIGPDRAEPDR